jgi:uncharacterized membrane protein
MEEARRRMQRSIYPWSGHDHRNPTVKRMHDERTLGERVADAVARFGGSWPFIFIFIGLIIGWMLLNTVFLARVIGHKQFDPYPYIALNLMLSGLAGLEAPIIMMSQNRASARDEALAGHHYEEPQRAERILGTLGELLETNTDLTKQVHDLTVQIHQVVAAGPRRPASR